MTTANDPKQWPPSNLTHLPHNVSLIYCFHFNVAWRSEQQQKQIMKRAKKSFIKMKIANNVVA